MKKAALCLCLLSAMLAGCVVTPVARPYYGPGVVAAPVVVVPHATVWVR
ncbi:MAG TPA: hypothetical protein VMU33_14850 [Burkholderiaceae bacterium]|nr:hypothetical protein [Burkholderiaceae bacterium]